MKKKINPRYAAYARAHGMTRDDMMAHDRQKYPGGCMCGFVVWISEQRQAFLKLHPAAFLGRHVIVDQESWTEFLQTEKTRDTGREEQKNDAEW